MSVARTELAPGYSISRVIKGGWQLAGGHGEIDRAAALDDMGAYVEAGITTFDCADIYTGVEQLIGDFRRRGTPDPRLRVHTKFVPDLDRLATIDAAEVRRLILRSIERLGLARLDLVQFHWWDYAVPRYIEVARYLADLQTEGLIELLGGTNFDAARTQEIEAAGVRFSTMQVQYSLLDARPAGAMARHCAHSGMRLLCFGTVAGGFLGTRWLGASQPADFENRSLVKYALIIEDAGGWDWFQALLRALDTVARRRGTDIATIASACVLAQPHVAAVIVGVRSRAHLAEHARIAAITLDAEDHAAIDSVLAQRRDLDGDVYTLERDRTGRHGRIMKYDLSK